MDFGRTGKVTFNEVGDRLGSVYSIMNVQADRSLQEVGVYRTNDPVRTDITLLLNAIMLFACRRGGTLCKVRTSFGLGIKHRFLKASRFLPT